MKLFRNLILALLLLASGFAEAQTVGQVPVGSSGGGWTYSGASATIGTSSLPIATTSAIGAVKPDGTTIAIGTTGIISATGSVSYPSAGIVVSTGSSYATSYTTSGTGTVVPLTASPTFTGTVVGASSTWSGTVGIGTTSLQSSGLYNYGANAVSGPVTSLTISTATFTPTFNASNDFTLTLVHASCPCTLANPSGTIVPGQHGVIYVVQSSTGSDTITTWGSSYLSSGGTSTIALSTGANAIDVLSYAVKDSTHIVLAPVLNVSH